MNRRPKFAWEGAATAPSCLIADFKKVGVLRNLSKGKTLFRQGKPARGAYLLRKGKARLIMTSKRGHEIHVRTVGRGYLLGFPGTLGSKVYNFTAEILENSEVIYLRRPALIRALRECGDVCLHLVRVLSSEFMDLTRRPDSIRTKARVQKAALKSAVAESRLH